MKEETSQTSILPSEERKRAKERNIYGLAYKIIQVISDEETPKQEGDLICNVIEPTSKLTKTVFLRPTHPLELSKRDGKWLDDIGCCKLCDGEIPYGHTDNCDMWKMEQAMTTAESVRLQETREKIKAQGSLAILTLKFELSEEENKRLLLEAGDQEKRANDLQLEVDSAGRDLDAIMGLIPNAPTFGGAGEAFGILTRIVSKKREIQKPRKRGEHEYPGGLGQVPVKQKVKVRPYLQFNRWAVLKADDLSLAWSGSRWVPIFGNVQVSNFSTAADAKDYAKEFSFEVIDESDQGK